MRTVIAAVTLATLLTAPLVAASRPASGPAARVDFDRDIRPILAANCYACHGFDAGKRQAGLRLDVRDAALAALPSGRKALVPGKPSASELVRRIVSESP